MTKKRLIVHALVHDPHSTNLEILDLNLETSDPLRSMIDHLVEGIQTDAVDGLILQAAVTVTEVGGVAKVDLLVLTGTLTRLGLITVRRIVDRLQSQRGKI